MPGDSGVLESPVIREALARFAAANRPGSEVRLILHSEPNPDSSVAFTVLTPRQEQALKRQLAEQVSSDPFVEHLQRAAIFDAVHMYNSVADEYEAAAQQAPASPDLLRAAITASAKVGDLHRAHELRTRIRQLDPRE